MSKLIQLFRQYLINGQEAAKTCCADPAKTIELLNENMKLSMMIYEEYEKEAN
jgi:hypothetical protein